MNIMNRRFVSMSQKGPLMIGIGVSVILSLLLLDLSPVEASNGLTRQRPYPRQDQKRFFQKQDQVHSLRIEYLSLREFPSLQQQVGLTVGIAPVKDGRRGRRHIGHYSFGGVSNYFKSEPFPLEVAIRDVLSEALSRFRIKTVPVSNWDRKKESLKDTETDSILSVQIERFWAEGRANPTPKLQMTLYLTFYLGVKKEGSVYTKRVYLGTNETVTGFTPERMERAVRQALTNVFESFFSDPY
jgi:hypothetical protein